MGTASYEQTAFTNGYEFATGAGYELPQFEFVPPPELKSGQPGRHRGRGLTTDRALRTSRDGTCSTVFHIATGVFFD